MAHTLPKYRPTRDSVFASLSPTTRSLIRILIAGVATTWVLLLFVKSTPMDESPQWTGSKSSKEGQLRSKLDINAEKRDLSSSRLRPSDLIIVAGHAVMRLSKLSVAQFEDSAWYLLPYQLKQGFPEIITSHIQRGIQLARDNPNSVLVFSGGETRKDVGPTSEAASYYYLAQESNWLTPNIATRTYLEEYARDSFENLLFSICRFREVTGTYPTRVTVVGFDFKGTRFTDLHRRAIGFPSDRFTYSGLRPKHPNFNHENAALGEKIAIAEFSKDMYGCKDPALSSKKSSRNPFHRTNPYELACPEIKDLLHWCGPELFDLSLLPWGRNNTSVKL